MQLRGRAVALSPALGPYDTGWRAIAMQPVTYTTDGRYLSASEVKQIASGSTLYVRRVYNDLSDRMHLSVWYFKSGFRNEIDNNTGSNSNRITVEDNKLCWVGLMAKGCFRFREMPDGAYVMTDIGNQRDYYFVTKLVRGDPEGAKAAWDKYERDQLPKDQRNTETINDVFEDLQRQFKEDQACAAMGGAPAGSGRCWVRR